MTPRVVISSSQDTRTDISNIARLAGWPDDCIVLASAGIMADFVGPTSEVHHDGPFVVLLACLLDAEVDEDGARYFGLGHRLGAERLRSAGPENSVVWAVRHDYPGRAPEFTVMYPSED